MTDMLSRAATGRVADARVATFRSVFAVVLGVEALFALLLLIVPGLALDPLGLEVAGGARISGALLLWTVLLQAPGQLNPVYNRMPVVIGVLGRGVCGLVCLLLGDGFWLLGAVALLFALALFYVYHRLVTAVISSRP